ncbi:MAG: hypothetical protein AAFY60_05700, partial [Myxococcota bacterium]
ALGAVNLELSQPALAGLNLRLPAPAGLPEGRRVFVMRRVPGGSELTQVATNLSGVMFNGSEDLEGATGPGLYDFVDCPGNCVVGRLLSSRSIPEFEEIVVRTSSAAVSRITRGADPVFVVPSGGTFEVDYLNGYVYDQFGPANFADFATVFVPGPSGPFSVASVRPEPASTDVLVKSVISVRFTDTLQVDDLLTVCDDVDTIEVGAGESCLCVSETDGLSRRCIDGQIQAIDRGDGRAEGVRFIPSTMLRFGRRYRIDLNRVLGDTNTRPEHALSDFEFTTVDPELLGTASLPVSRAQSRPIRDIRELEGRQVAITHGDTNAASSLRLPTVSVADWGEGVSPSFESYADSEVGVPRTIATLGGNEFVTTFIPFSLTASSRLAVFDASSFPPQFPNPPKKLFLFGGDEALPPIDFFTEIGSNFSFGNLFAPLPLSFELLAPPSAVAVAPNDVMAYDPAEEMIYAAVLGRGIQTISVPYIKLDTQVAGTLVPLFSYRWPEVVELAVADKLVFATDLEEIRIIGGGKQIGGSSESRLPGRIYGYTDMQLIDRLGLGGAKPSRLEATDAFPFDVDGDGVFEESREPRVSVLAVGAQDALGRAQLRTFVVDRLAGIGQEFVRPVSTISLGVDEFVRHISIDTEEGLIAVATQSTVSIVDASDLSASPEMDEIAPDPRVLKQWTSTPIAADRDNTGSFLQIESAGPVAFGERGRLYMGDPDAEGESAPTLALYRLPLAEIAIGELSDETVAINEAGLMASDLTVPFELNVEQSLADLSEVTVIFTDAQGTELYRETAAPGAREVVVERRDVAWPLDSQVLVY